MANMIPISTVTVGSGGATSIEFANIPQSYTDLAILLSPRSDANSTGSYVSGRFNNVASIYRHIELYAENSTPTSSKTNAGSSYLFTLGHTPANTATSNTFGNTFIYIPNYTSTNDKSVSAEGTAENNSSTNGNWTVSMTTGLATLTVPITVITLTMGNAASSNFMQYSSATLYGIRKY